MHHPIDRSLKAFAGLFIALWVSSSAQAHLHDSNVPPCFAMSGAEVRELPNTSGDNFIRFGRIEITPANTAQLTASEYLYVTVHVTGKLCSPYMVFLYPQTQGPTPLIVGSRPSLVHPPGSFDNDFTLFVTLSVDPKNVVPGSTGEVSSVLLRIVQYGSEREYAHVDIPVNATWRVPRQPIVRNFPEYECIDDMRLPPAENVPPHCANSIAVPAGGRLGDLNQDGICEMFIRDELCDRTYGNLCYRVMAERNGAWQPIAVSYNQVTEHSSATGYRGLSFVEHGPLSETTWYSEWVSDTYLTHKYLHDCSLVPK